VPKLWSDTIEAHRRTVSDAILDTTAQLVAERGLASVTMSEIAEDAGVGRATLYKYFADVDAILVSWHDRHVARHLERLSQVRDRSDDPREQLEAVLEAYALISRERSSGHHEERRSHAHHQAHRPAHQDHAGDIGALVHRDEHVAGAERRLVDLLTDVISRAVMVGAVRADIPADELARFCLHALATSASLPTRAAVERLVAVTLAGLRPPRR
jgi:AcrR family transcriptional regulator